ncbi:MAG: phospholipase D family protein, partial [Pseudomonadota bacterium]
MMFIKPVWMPWLILIALLIPACASLPTAFHREPSVAYASGMDTSLGRMFETQISEHPGESGVQVLDTGREALQLRLALLGMAERAIDLQYYIWNSDFSGRLLAERVIQVADRGVRVRLLLDDFNVNGRDVLLSAMDAHPNIQVRIYNPNANRKGLAKWLALMGDFGRLNQRMHNKSFVVDGSAAIVGGRNIGDEYFDLGEAVNFRDRDLLTVGPVVGEISQGFDTYWNSQRSYPIDAIASDRPGADEIQAMRFELQSDMQRHADPGNSLPLDRASSLSMMRVWRSELIWADARVLIDQVPSPAETNSEKRRQLAQRLTHMARQAGSEVLIESAYLVLGDAGASLLKELTGRGVRVRALTNSLASNDLTTNHSA